MIFPEKLQKGDTIAIVAPAGFINEDENLQVAIKLLESWGLNVQLGEHTFKRHFHFAGTDEQRLYDLQQALDNPKIKAIWCSAGRYGLIRIIDKLDFTAFLQHPKWIIGYSDITILLSRVFNLGVASIHGFMPTSKESLKNNDVTNALRSILFGKTISYTTNAHDKNRLGNAKGTLVGGNLAILSSLLGSNCQFTNKNSVLFIEDIGEYKYKIDRTLHSLKRANYFDNCNALIVGGMTNIIPNDPAFGKDIEDIILDICSEYDFPICFDFKTGHIPENYPLVIGSEVELLVEEEKTVLNYI